MNQFGTNIHMYGDSANGIQNALVVYSAKDFVPNRYNHRLVGIKPESLDRLNQSMERLYGGNSQIFTTMLYKDVDRAKLIIQFWEDLQLTPEFKNLPDVFKDLEFEQIRKVGPKSRWSEEKLRESFTDHISERNKHYCSNLKEFESARNVLVRYWLYCFRKIDKRILEKYVNEICDFKQAKVNLPKDSNSGDPLFISNDKNVAGVLANDLAEKYAKELQATKLQKELYYTMFKRVQSKGNNLFTDDGRPVYDTGLRDPWKKEKNRVVQGDSRAYAILGKGTANLFTSLLPSVDPCMAAWANDDILNEACKNFLNTYSDSYDFKSFDAESYDATTDPKLFSLAMLVVFDVVEELGGKLPFPKNAWEDHFMHAPTITPWGIYQRTSLPSGHIWTNLVGTVANHLRNIVQTARTFECSHEDLLYIMIDNQSKNIPLFLALGDDAVQLVKKGTTTSESSAQDNLDGYGSNPDKTIITADYFHFLQKGFSNTHGIYGYYPISRALESILFQEYANQYNASLVSVNAIMVINNCRFNPLQEYLIEFVLAGDPLNRLGTKIGYKRLFKDASDTGRTIASLLDREWDPKYAGVDYNTFGDNIKDTLGLISTVAAKIYN